jgi:hypothetical protein
VTIDHETRETVERVAKREDRTLAAQVRYFACRGDGLRAPALQQLIAAIVLYELPPSIRYCWADPRNNPE